MRPLRLLLSLSTSLVAVTLLVYIAFAAPQDEEFERTSVSPAEGNFKSFFSFTSPGSLFPPSAIISLTDDNSTFFLARPAAFGPALPNNGLSGPLWIGSGFGDDTMGKGELGCGDVAGWHDGSDGLLSTVKPTTDIKTKTKGTSLDKDVAPSEGIYRDKKVDTLQEAAVNDGTDDHLWPDTLKTYTPPNIDHADIQSIQESAEMAGKVALLKRGGCGFLAKVQWAQRRGATAVIVGDDVRGGALVRMYAKGDTSNITIPSLFTSHTTAHLLSSLLPSERLIDESKLGDKAKAGHAESGKGMDQETGNKQNSKAWSTLTKGNRKSTQPASRGGQNELASAKETAPKETGWLHSFLSSIGFGGGEDTLPKAGSRRIPNSGDHDWVQVGDWDDDQEPIKTKSALPSPASTLGLDAFIIGEQDWRDPDLLPLPSSTNEPRKATSSSPAVVKRGDNVLPGSGEYTRTTGADFKHRTWWSRWSGSGTETPPKARTKPAKIRSVTSITSPDLKKVQTTSIEPASHQGLWVTLTPTNVSTSPFFDTLLVLVVSPLVTLTVVYALLLLRSRIRRRRWRAPKSVVERLPVRTYQTISETSSSATPHASSPTTPLLQHSPSQPTSSAPQSRSRSDSETPATSSSVQHGSRGREEEKGESGLAAWRRRYGGRQKECVVCLEEYVDGVSQVMSLPCGHEFHADCITPWLVTRRRTCPICKGDVVRSLSQSYHDRLQSPSPTRSARFLDNVDEVQTEVAETRNESASASRPMPIALSPPVEYSPPTGDVEANWSGEDRQQSGRDIPDTRPVELSTSLRDLSSTVSTVIWRGLEAVRSSTGLQRRPLPEDVDRDR
ncbi:uncharacterized protein K460DRAFT_409006 [Cucurbitaria berberidis CBS 394.84]|uniref:RING-type E3 ubiquitin transferase n=1 Tax=Cucurbitaria berberidis CBS 394.84 TaxID=1168544 RepID=A0A9P4G9I8_9PLEO|nr:uncharacterized protein K460DRAFT_409006 [Cucurbitaria berberidis CBS 394.84]KAF1841547.1 hypothetical protein K460DRAFT_409006 [Cucurbitaria berberidis CBS 394.84]